MWEPKKKTYFVVPLLAAAILFLAGCGKSGSQSLGETAAEKMIEAQSGGQAQVDINDQNVKVETEQGTMEAGESVELPADFPADVYVIEGTIKTAITDRENQGQTISVETAKGVAEASAIYQEKLAAAGWQITGTMSFGEAATVTGEKDERMVSIVAGKSDGVTIVNISVGKK